RSIVRLAAVELDALPWDSFIQSISPKPSESARKIIEEDRPFSVAPHVYIDHSYGKSSIIWPGNEFATVRLSFEKERNTYYRELKPLQYALSQALSTGITHVYLHTQNGIVYNVATRQYKANKEQEIYRLLWRAMESSDAPVKARLVLQKGEEEVIKKTKTHKDMTEIEFVDSLGRVVDRLKVL
ncbi:hypothetical protein PFISCL1PPCAC_5410, partial [Pristionchus fissidentatus]